MTRPLRAVLIDAHAISRAACRALLRTEGIAVLADLDDGAASVAAIAGLDADVVIIDVSYGSPRGVDIARQLAELPHGARVLVTSCGECPAPGAELEGVPFIPKPEICARSVMAALGAPHPIGDSVT